MTTTATKKDNEDLLYPPHQLSPKAPFKFPSPLPSRVPSPAPVSQSSSSSSSSFSHEDANGSKRKRPLSLSAFHPGPIDDTAPSIPLPPLSPSTKPPPTNGVIPAVSSAPRASPSPSPQPTRPHSCSNANGNPGAPGVGASTATESTKTTTRRSPPSFYKHGVHVPQHECILRIRLGDYEDIEGTCQAGRVEEEPCDGERGKGAGAWNRGWKVHRSTPSRRPHIRIRHRETHVAICASALLPAFPPSLSLPSPLSLLEYLEYWTWVAQHEDARVRCAAGRAEDADADVYTAAALVPPQPARVHPMRRVGVFYGRAGSCRRAPTCALPPPPSRLPLPLGLVPGLPSNFRFPNLVLGPLGARTSLLLNGLLAFLLNVASFAANKRVGPRGDERGGKHEAGDGGGDFGGGV
ncbi:hypothetical protein FA13DRAFT_219784 [Coprinellus micaceus]|uniref:Uncharacterized protein n=1 Tax=Coprinellus micaceus TaxID=71717 RepID=A0A4Y7TFC5_COPMI|nr:hypothetical protein FA13DRAFT_219784 [Coprinellus micaceus]